MKKCITKKKVVFSLTFDILEFLNNFENKSKYVEYLIYKDMIDSGLLKKDEFKWMN